MKYFSEKNSDQYIEFKQYFEKFREKFFVWNLDYTKIDKEYHSNSYIENYNKRIKLKLSEYLFENQKLKFLGLCLIILL